MPRFRLSSLLWGLLLIAVLCSWWRDHVRLEQRIADLTGPSPYWGADQATGPPNTTTMGDITTAWASRTPDGQREWLLLDYGRAIRPVAVAIYETFNPGAVDRITAYDSGGNEQDVWSGADPANIEGSVAVARIPISIGFATRKIKIHLNSPAVSGWNEIDAVGLIDAQGRTHWAQEAEASSSYGVYATRRYRWSW